MRCRQRKKRAAAVNAAPPPKYALPGAVAGLPAPAPPLLVQATAPLEAEDEAVDMAFFDRPPTRIPTWFDELLTADAPLNAAACANPITLKVPPLFQGDDHEAVALAKGQKFLIDSVRAKFDRTEVADGVLEDAVLVVTQPTIMHSGPAHRRNKAAGQEVFDAISEALQGASAEQVPEAVAEVARLSLQGLLDGSLQRWFVESEH
ncbi:hypothetical protein M885DRAFT_569978 [Pelagophyceae sp. CCMP2097]|nr:hypothetical protein M885DRAFT_569978 [Pelagophyceae sp. CCMP2097]